MSKSLPCVAEDNFYVYKLICPESDRPKYIGITSNPEERLRKHLTHKKRTLKNNWIKNLTQRGLKPVMILIDSSPTRPGINEKEKYWIIKYKEWGCDLKNMTDGGDGGDTWTGRKHTQLSKDKISIANTGKKRVNMLNLSKRKTVQQVIPATGEIVGIFESTRIAAEKTGCSRTNISKFAAGKLTVNHVGGYVWQYLN